jgi:hypothetical protein
MPAGRSEFATGDVDRLIQQNANPLWFPGGERHPWPDAYPRGFPEHLRDQYDAVHAHLLDDLGFGQDTPTPSCGWAGGISTSNWLPSRRAAEGSPRASSGSRPGWPG